MATFCRSRGTIGLDFHGEFYGKYANRVKRVIAMGEQKTAIRLMKEEKGEH